jgi:hypothetical protein
MLLLAGGLVGSSSLTHSASTLDVAPPLPERQHGALRRAILMDVALKELNSSPLVLKLVMRYVGDKEVSIYGSSLPWGNTYSLMLMAVKTDASSRPLSPGWADGS